MAHWERSPLTGELRIVAPSRTARPNLYRQEDEPCPFCPGNEHLTPPTIFSTPAEREWTTRVFENRYPLTGSGDADSVEGHSEVIVETREHGTPFEEISADDGARALEAWQERITHHRHERFAMLFKNEGRWAGASIPHAHSQLVVLKHLPPRSRGIVDEFSGACPACDLADHTPLQIERNDGFVFAASPGAPRPWQTVILPAEHPGDVRLDGLFPLLRRSIARIREITDGAPYNLVLHYYPPAVRHWFLEITPRVPYGAGLEIGSGLNVSHRTAEEQARTIRER